MFGRFAQSLQHFEIGIERGFKARLLCFQAVEPFGLEPFECYRIVFKIQYIAMIGFSELAFFS